MLLPSASPSPEPSPLSPPKRAPAARRCLCCLCGRKIVHVPSQYCIDCNSYISQFNERWRKKGCGTTNCSWNRGYWEHWFFARPIASSLPKQTFLSVTYVLTCTNIFAVVGSLLVQHSCKLITGSFFYLKQCLVTYGSSTSTYALWGCFWPPLWQRYATHVLSVPWQIIMNALKNADRMN